MAIKLFLTGGTIDKQYNALNGELIFAQSHIADMLKQARCTVDVAVEQLMLLDSLDITAEQRDKILAACQNTPEQQIIITHGTDTMAETAELLGNNIHDKVIVLFGAMVPYAFGGSDGLFNLGSACIAAQTLDAGVYIVMNGKVFLWDNVAKNKELGEFQSKQA